MAIRRSGSAYGIGSSSAASMTLKIAVLAPIPSARLSTAAAVKDGCWINIREACWMS